MMFYFSLFLCFVFLLYLVRFTRAGTVMTMVRAASLAPGRHLLAEGPVSKAQRKPKACPGYSSLQQVQGTWMGATFPLRKPLGVGNPQRGYKEGIYTLGGL